MMVRIASAKIRKTETKQIKFELMESLLHINNNLTTITEYFSSQFIKPLLATCYLVRGTTNNNYSGLHYKQKREKKSKMTY